MTNHQDSDTNERNPFAPPFAAIRAERSVVQAAFPPPRGSVYAIRHDLTDHDLKRFYGLDFFYDPTPLFGLIPQWIILILILLAMANIAVLWSGYSILNDLRLWSKLPTWLFGLAAGGVAAAATCTGSLARMSQLRRSARDGGFLLGRQITISELGVQVSYPQFADEDRLAFEARERKQVETVARLPVLSQTGIVAAIYPWRDFTRVAFRDGYLIFWLSGRSRLVIPTQVFASRDAAETFALAAAGWIASRK